MQKKIDFPFTAILGQDDFKLCLELNIIDPSIGGVLATGDKGTGKTTAVRAISQLMGNDFSFVNLPIGASEDRVLGSINLEALINKKQTVISKGLLAQAHKGILYIDEVNLLNDYLMDVLLDASASGGYQLERDSISSWQDSNFCLVGTMNPEEGNLRPQLLDRFGLSVAIQTPKNITLRKKIAVSRLNFDADHTTFYNGVKEAELFERTKLLDARKNLNTIQISDEVYDLAAKLTIDNNVEGMRADILLLKTVRAYAAYLGETTTTPSMLDKIAPFVLLHRSKNQNPPSSNNDSTTDQKKNEEETSESKLPSHQDFQLPEAVQKGLKFSLTSPSKKQEVKLERLDQAQTVQYKAKTQNKIDTFKSVKKYMTTGTFAAIYKQVSNKAVARIVFLVDTSASMALDKQLGYVKGIIEKTLQQNPLKKMHYAIIGLEAQTAKIIQEFTTNVKLLSETTYNLRAGGKTNLGSAFFKVYELLKNRPYQTVELFILTDGKINNGTSNPFQYAIETYKTYLSKIPQSTVVDTENGFVRLKKAKQLADTLHLNYTRLAIN